MCDVPLLQHSKRVQYVWQRYESVTYVCLLCPRMSQFLENVVQCILTDSKLADRQTDQQSVSQTDWLGKLTDSQTDRPYLV